MIRGRRLLLGLAGVVALGAGIWMGQPFQRPATSEPLAISGIYFPEPYRKALENFTLVHQTGRALNRDDFKGRWTFIYFGYTYCPDICPLTLNYLNAVEQRLSDENLDDINFLFVSVDPARDQPQRLGQYAAYFNEKFQGATGTPQELAKLANQLGVYYHIPKHEDSENYAVDHSSTVILIDPDAGLHAIFTRPDDPQAIAADFLRMHALYRSLN